MGPKTTSRTSLQFSPETIEILGQELMTQLRQLDPIQRERIIEAATLSIGQPGAANAPGGLPANLFAPATAAARKSAEGAGLDFTQLSSIMEALNPGQRAGQGAARRQASQTLGGISSFVDPRFAQAFAPKQSSSSSTSDPVGTGLAAGGTAAVLAGAAVAI